MIIKCKKQNHIVNVCVQKSCMGWDLRCVGVWVGSNMLISLLMGELLKLSNIVAICSDSCWIANWLLGGICISIQVFTPRVHVLTESAKANSKAGTCKHRKLQGFHPILAASVTWHVTSWIMNNGATEARLGDLCPLVNIEYKQTKNKRCVFFSCLPHLIWRSTSFLYADVGTHTRAHLKTLTLSRRQGYRIRSEWKDQRAQMWGLYIFNSCSVPESPRLDKSSEALSSVSFRHTV